MGLVEFDLEKGPKSEPASGELEAGSCEEVEEDTEIEELSAGFDKVNGLADPVRRGGDRVKVRGRDVRLGGQLREEDAVCWGLTVEAGEGDVW
jgi:hypothetical protein